MNSKFIYCICVLSVVLSIGAYYSGFAYGVYVTSQLGVMIGNIVDDGTPCPGDDEQLVLDFENIAGGSTGLGEQWVSMACLGSTCLPATRLHGGVLTACQDPPGVLPSTCDPSIILATVANVFPFNMETELYGTGIATTLLAGIGIGMDTEPLECIDVDGHCVVVDTIIAVPEYNAYYVSDDHADTFGALRLSICRISSALESVTTDCLALAGESNNAVKPMAVDPTTNTLYIGHKAFNLKVERVALTSDGGLLMSTGVSADLGFTFVTIPFDGIVVDHGGDVYIGGWDGNTAIVKQIDPVTLIVSDTFPAGITTSGSSNFHSLWYDQNLDTLYSCGSNVTSSFVTLAKLSNDGTILATATRADIGVCLMVRTSRVTGDVFVVGSDIIYWLDKDTLAVKQSLVLNNRVPRGLTIDDARGKIYLASDDFIFSQGNVFSIDTCA